MTAPVEQPWMVEREDLALAAKALSDPIRLHMLDALAEGRGCCGLPEPSSKGISGPAEPVGICVCEFQEQLGLGQSKVSYHLHVLREAGLVDVDERGKWAFYSLRAERLEALLSTIEGWLSPRDPCVTSLPSKEPEDR